MVFTDYLINNTNLSQSSIEHYEGGLRSINRLATEEKLIDKPLEELSIEELEIVFELLRQNNIFINKDTVGRRMYSNSLRHFISYRKSENHLKVDEKLIDSIKHDKTLSVTEKESLIKSRIGQGIFREKILQKYNGACFISGVSDNRLLIASHIKPWAVSDNNERLDTENGFLMNVLYDKLFDLGIITFTETGDMLISKSLKEENIERLHITKKRKFDLLMSPTLKKNLEYHRDVIYLK